MAARKVWDVEVANPGLLRIDAPALSDDPGDVFRATLGPPGKSNMIVHPVVVSWKTSQPADASVEYAPVGSSDWKRNMKPAALTDHRLVLSPLTPGTSYRLRLKSMTADGRIARTELTYNCPSPKT
jgi:hypothetical protein